MDVDKLRTWGATKQLPIPYDLAPGEVLIRHPYHQGYIKASDAEETYLSESTNGIFLIARALGATKISYKNSNIAESKREITNNNDVKYKVVEANLGIQQSVNQKLAYSITKEQVIEREPFNKEKFNKAVIIARERGLLSSRDIKDLIDSRNPEIGVPISQQYVKVEISSSLNTLLDIAFTVNVVPFFHLNSNTKVATEKKLDMVVEWEIIF